MRHPAVIASVLSFCLALAGCSGTAGSKTVNGLAIEGSCSPADVVFFDGFYTAMIEAVRTEDVDKSMGFYSEAFREKTPESLKKLRLNTERLYANYRNLVYAPGKIRLSGDPGEAVTTDDYSFSAIPDDARTFKPLSYTGKERIYWKKANGVWKIVDWIYY